MFMRLWLLALVLVGALATPVQAAPRDYATPIIQSARRECVVYVTRTGNRSHVDGCRYLRYSSIPLTRTRAEAAGYTPCRVCGGSDC